MTEPARILLVDDEEVIVFAVGECLRARGYVVDEACSRREAEALIEAQRYAVVVSDLRLTSHDDRDGLAVLSRAREISPQTRLVLLTAYGDPAIRAEARRRGADCVLDKPLPVAELEAAVGRLLAAAQDDQEQEPGSGGGA